MTEALGAARLRVGADIGGTFTDLVAVRSDGSYRTKKVSSTVDDYAQGIVDGLSELLQEMASDPAEVAELRHGTTVASNAILERKGARTGLITTKGFRDVLEIRTLRMPRLYDMAWEKPPVLVPRHLRLAVDERIAADGSVVRPLAMAGAEAAIRSLLAEGAEAIAVCLLHAYANPAHEILIKQAIHRLAPHMPCSVSHEVLSEINEYNRVSTTVINAYVKPAIARYLKVLQRQLEGMKIAAPLLLMQSNGGLAPARSAMEFPMNIVESGPAGGVTGAQAIADASGHPRIITFDMGGTTAKAAMIEDGAVTRAAEYQVGGGIMIGSRLLTGAGYMLKVPAIDLAEVGAGGGSIIWRDPGGALRIGPESAGAFPGPVCYDLGGERPTVTDANVILGYLNPTYLVDGKVRLNAAKARNSLESKIARPLDLSVEEAAFGACRIATSNMIQAIRAVSIERGRDPRAFSLFAFGGNGPLFAVGMARLLDMRRVIVPPAPGVFSSLGLLYADVEHHFSHGLRAGLKDIDVEVLNAAWDRLEARARSVLANEGFVGPEVQLSRSASLRYQGQSFELSVPVPAGRLYAALLGKLEEAFATEHERTYGHRAEAGEPVEIVGLQLIGRSRRRQTLPRRLDDSGRGPSGPLAPRQVYFGPAIGWLETAVVRRSELAGPRAGPLIVEEYDATCLVPPGCTAVLDAHGNIVIDVTP